jgi:hypothetical protein
MSEERETLMALLQYQRESVIRKVLGVDRAAAAHSPVPSGTSLLWLVKHLALAEDLWFLARFAGQDVADREDTVTDSDTAESLVARYRATWARVDPVIAAADLDDVVRKPDRRGPINLRWVIAHMLEETARHAGHADILRELIDGETGR